MSKLNKDVLSLILEELQNDKKSLYSCLLVNRTWCELTVPSLWKNPWHCNMTNNAKLILFNVILLHLSEESRDILKDRKFNLFTEEYQQPSFNYISFWKHLNLWFLESAIASIKNIKASKLSIVRNEIWKLFINRNTRFTHLYMSKISNEVHLIQGAEHCFSELKYLYCSTENFHDSLLGLSRIINKSIKTLVIHIYPYNNNFGIVKLIEAQKNLNDVRFVHTEGRSLHRAVEESLIKHADTIKHLQIRWGPTKVLSYLVNLQSLEIFISHYAMLSGDSRAHLENVSLPVLKILKACNVPSNSLVSLIKNTKGSLKEISINSGCESNGLLIQAIYQNCPNLEYLKLCLETSNLSEFEKLLINCQYLNGLVITSFCKLDTIGWNNLFKILIKSSPTSLFKFKFHSDFRLESLKFFLDNWKGKHPMFIQIDQLSNTRERYDYLIEGYKAEGIVKKYDDYHRSFSENFEWI